MPVYTENKPTETMNVTASSLNTPSYAELTEALADATNQLLSVGVSSAGQDRYMSDLVSRAMAAETSGQGIHLAFDRQSMEIRAVRHVAPIPASVRRTLTTVAATHVRRDLRRMVSGRPGERRGSIFTQDSARMEVVA